MCGIAGLFRLDGLDPRPLPEMVARLQHRGPDDQGTKVFEDHGRAWAAIGMRRLSIVDRAGGHQPLSDPEDRIWLVMNGEVYNHNPLRREMGANGVAFRTASDTEVLAQLLADLPLERALGRVEGMFAFAAVDVAARRLTLVRDRMGKKPLYWTTLADGTVAFASELKALRGLRRTWTEDRRALQSLLLWEYIPAPWTCWTGVQKLEPGCALVVDAHGVREERWWTPPVPEAGHGGNLEKWAQSVYGAFQVATLHRLQADVEVGCLLSGGLDSSSVAAMAQSKRSRPIHTFSVAVDAPGFDEAPHARAIAAALGTAHREVRLGPQDLPGLLDAITAHMDEPLADSSLVPTWRLMQLVSESGLRCVLSGDGADEGFAGYPTVFAHRYAPLAAPARGLLGALGAALPTTYGGVSRDYKLRRLALGLGQPWQRAHQLWMGAWAPDELGVRAEDAIWSVVDRHAAAADGADPASRALYLDARLYLAEGVLTKVDRASMAFGVEVRSPFLDRFVVELAASIPIGHKIHGRTGKVVLRRAMAGLVPEPALQRAKQGFGAPLGPWLRGPHQGLLDGLEDRVSDLVAPDALRRVRAEHLDGRADHRRRLWSALVLARWRGGPWA